MEVSDIPAIQAISPKKKTEFVKDLIPFTDPLLRSRLPEFDFANPPEDPMKISKILGDSVIYYEGYGLSANQIGLPYRAFSIRSNPVFVMFNPEIVDRSSTMEKMAEGCLSLPGIVGKVKRNQIIRVRFAMPNGDVQTMKFVGITARVIQHELDHLNGIFFTDYLTRLELEMALKKAKSRGHKYGFHQLGAKRVTEEPTKAEEIRGFNPFIFPDEG